MRLIKFAALAALLATASVCPAQAQLGAFMLAKAPSSSPTLMLDGVAQALGAYSTRKLRTAYAGPALRVIRASDSTQSDIGFTGSPPVFNTAALNSFCTGTTCTVTKWYDQSGSANDCSASTGLPTIYTGGAVTTMNGHPATSWPGGSTDTLPCPESASPTNIRYFDAVMLSTDFSQSQYIFGATALGDGMVFDLENTIGVEQLSVPGVGLIGAGTTDASLTTGNVLEGQYNPVGGAYAFWLDGTADGSGSQTQVITPGANVSLCGLQFEPSCNAVVGELVIYDNLTGRPAIQANQKAYWGTP